MDFFIILFLILFSIGVISILLANREHLRRFLSELEIIGVVFLLILVIHIQQMIINESPVEWSLNSSENLSYNYVFTIPNACEIEVYNITRMANTIKIYINYSECNNTDVETYVSIFLPQNYKNYVKELVLNKKSNN